MERRDFLRALAAVPLASAAGRDATAADLRIALEARPARVALVGAEHPATDVWCFEGRVPGPEIRVKRGARFRADVVNRLPEETTVHWHGVRVPNAMDGVPHLTQAPIAAGGGTFAYEFVVPDSGTFWYHPHARGHEQIDRGLHGAIVVEEVNPPNVDRDLVWVLDDWRLNRDAAITEDFGAWFDVTHAGRIGNTVTVNGAVREEFAVRAGERLRLRLVNVANARVFALQFAGHRPWIVALDGHAVTPHEPERGTIVVGPSQRADVILDAVGQPESRHVVRDVRYPRQAYRLLDLAYAAAAPIRSESAGAPMRVEPNALAEPDLARAETHDVVLSGGAMGRLPEEPWNAGLARSLRRLLGSRESDPAWAINGTPATGDHTHRPLLDVRRGASVILNLRNDSAWPHPMHLHGHAFRVLARNGQPAARREWRDTVMLEARETAQVAFVADNPGDWMLHCHILEHQAGGMMAAIRVSA